MGHSLYFYDMLVEVTCEILFNLQKIPWACYNRGLQVMKGGVSSSLLFGGNFKKRHDVRRQGLVCTPVLRMRITKKKGCWQQTCKVSQKSQTYFCITVEDLGNPFDQKKGCQSILTNRLDKMVAIYTRSLANFLWTNLDKSFYIFRVKMDAAVVLMMMVILT